ncbi:MAG: hypothetical protein NVS3B20_04190 [Polyangiales bacterium]
MRTTTKRDLREGYPFGFLATARNRIATYHESSGPSGEPISSYFTQGDWDEVVDRFARCGADLSASDTVLVRTPYSMLTTAHQMHHAARTRGAMVVPADHRSSNMTYSKVVRILRDLQVTVTWSTPTEVFLWAEAARVGGYSEARDFSKLRAMIVASEPLTKERARAMTALFPSARVYQDYGSTETGSLAGECSRGNLHLWADRFVCEVREPYTDAFTRTGRGQLVVTSLFREAMPLVRYDMEDFVEIDEEPCPCGWNLPRLKVLGRTSERLSVAGVFFFPSDLESCVYSLSPSCRVLFWRARCTDESLHLEIEVSNENADRARAELKELVLARVGVTATVTAVARGTLVSRGALVEKARVTKAKYVFGPHEDWSTALRSG